MKKGLRFIFAMAAILLLAACGQNAATNDSETSSSSKAEDKIIKVASQTTPMTDVVEVAAKVAAEDGWEIQLVEVNDNVQYNELLKNGEVDANFAQHKPYMEQFNEKNDGNLVALDKIYNAKVGFYSKNYTNIADIPDGATVAMPSDVSNEGRALAILADQGLITLREGVGFNGTLEDITENPHDLQWLSVDLLNLAEAYDEENVALVYNYPTYIAKIGLTPDDALFLEENVDDRFAISLVAREDNQDSEKIKALEKAMTSDEVRDFLVNGHSATLVPAF